jgi:ubiquinone/menaquinone biosynthesis C-methylase UbiE
MSNEPTEPDQPMLSWNSSERAEGWQQEAERRQQLLGEATERMLEAAQLGPGDRVLDIAAGTGDQSLLAARKVGPGGTVLATDLSEDMLTVAARLAQQEGLANITTQVLDAEQLDLEANSFDAVISRLGLMFVPQLSQALGKILSVLKPGGKLAALVWSAPARNPLTAVPLTLLEQYTGASFLGAAGPFALADPRHFEQVLKEAGFHEVTIQAIPVRFQFPSLEAFMLQGRRTVGGMMERLSQQEQERLAQDIRQGLRQFEGPQGLVAPGEVLLGVGTKAGSRRSSGS